MVVAKEKDGGGSSGPVVVAIAAVLLGMVAFKGVSWVARRRRDVIRERRVWRGVEDRFREFRQRVVSKGIMRRVRDSKRMWERRWVHFRRLRRA